jgi:hypothetical protein
MFSEPAIKTRHCGHIFHHSCLAEWLDMAKLTCPMCRTILLGQEATPLTSPNLSWHQRVGEITLENITRYEIGYAMVEDEEVVVGVETRLLEAWEQNHPELPQHWREGDAWFATSSRLWPAVWRDVELITGDRLVDDE